MKKILLTSLLAFLFFTPSLFAQIVPDIPAGTAEDYYNRGNKYREQGNLDQAIYDYTKAIKVYSKHAKAYYNRANSYVKQGKLSQAVDDYNKALEINPQYTEAYYNLGNTYEKQGNLSKAIESYTKALETNPKYSAAYCNRGNVYQAQGNFQQAIDDYNKAIEINPNFAGVYSNRGNVYQAQGQTDKALADYNKAIEMNPNFAGFYANRGSIYQNQGNLKQAISDYNNAIDKSPDESSLFYNRGLAYYGMEEYSKSLADYSTALNKNPDKDAYDDFVKYFPQKRDSDTGNIRAEIVQIFEDKLGLTKKVAAPVAAAPADVVASVSAAPAEPIAPAAPATDIAQASAPQNVNKTTPKDDVRVSVYKWLNSWRAGDMETYRSCYDESFESRKMKLNEWIAYKTNVRNKSKDINILIDDLKISTDGDKATAVFTQTYSSSILRNKGKKTLELKKVGNEWKIVKEIM
jgi:tetratricopeptide (TPR) repeat protein